MPVADRGFVSLVKRDDFDLDKFKLVLHYIISKCGNKPNVGKTVLFKLLYFSDFNFYEIYEKKMTGEIYTKLPHGPAPLHFDKAIVELEEEGKIEPYEAEYVGYTQNKFKSLEQPSVDELQNDEKETIDYAIDECAHMNATTISNHSHEDIPYEATDDLDIIDYELVFYRDSKFSVKVELDE